LQTDLSWIVPQIQTEIAKGKITSKSIKDLSRVQDLTLFESYEAAPFKMSSKEQVLTSQAYSNLEQVIILLDAIHEVAQINEIRKQIMNNLKEIDRGVTSVEFASEETDNFIVLTDKNGTEVMDNTYSNLIRIINEIKVNTQ
jgi:hypothetical protein